MKVSFTKLYKAIVLLAICLTSLTPAFAQNISIANGCLSGYLLAYEAPDQNGKKYFGSTNTQTIIFGGVTYTNENIAVFWAITGDNVNLGGGTIANNKWVAVIAGGNDAVLYHPTATGSLPPPTGWVSNTTKTCTNATSTVMSGTGVLPIELMSFDATIEGSKNHLTWATVSETNNKGFDIERSRDGENFQAIGTIKAIGKAGNYNFTDAQPVNGTNYYRLKSIDNDGSFAYSKTVAIETGKGKKSIKIFPTNTEGVVHIQNDDLTGVNVSVFNAMGQLVYANKSTNSVDLSGIVAGLYFIEVQTGNGKVVEKVFKR